MVRTSAVAMEVTVIAEWKNVKSARAVLRVVVLEIMRVTIVKCMGNGGYGDSGGYGEPENGEDNAPSEHTHPGWNITYDSMKANLTVGSTEELIFMYKISSTRAYEYKLHEKDCFTEIGDNLITDNWASSESNEDGTDRLTIFYDIDQSAIASSPIWNQTSQEMKMCLLLSLFEPATADDPRMIIAQDKHVFTVGVNSTVDFSFENALQDADAGELPVQ
eukprot:scaffold137561_cov48-Cyclotella_meneghiniana.AAC.1